MSIVHCIFRCALMRTLCLRAFLFQGSIIFCAIICLESTTFLIKNFNWMRATLLLVWTGCNTIFSWMCLSKGLSESSRTFLIASQWMQAKCLVLSIAIDLPDYGCVQLTLTFIALMLQMFLWNTFFMFGDF